MSTLISPAATPSIGATTSFGAKTPMKAGSLATSGANADNLKALAYLTSLANTNIHHHNANHLNNHNIIPNHNSHRNNNHQYHNNNSSSAMLSRASCTALNADNIKDKVANRSPTISTAQNHNNNNNNHHDNSKSCCPVVSTCSSSPPCSFSPPASSRLPQRQNSMMRGSISSKSPPLSPGADSLISASSSSSSYSVSMTTTNAAEAPLTPSPPPTTTVTPSPQATTTMTTRLSTINDGQIENNVNDIGRERLTSEKRTDIQSPRQQPPQSPSASVMSRDSAAPHSPPQTPPHNHHHHHHSHHGHHHFDRLHHHHHHRTSEVPSLDEIPLANWISKFEAAIPGETLLKQKLDHLCITGDSIYPIDTGLVKSQQHQDAVKLLHKLHAPFLKLYVEQFHDEMRKVCKEMLSSMHQHYESALKWMREELAVAVQRLAQSLLLRNAKKNVVDKALETSSSSKPNRDSFALISDEDLEEEEEVAAEEDRVGVKAPSSSPDRETSPGDSGNSLGNSEEDILVRGDKERLHELYEQIHFRFPNASSSTSTTTMTKNSMLKRSKCFVEKSSATEEGTLKLVQYVLHLHKKVQSLESKAESAQRQKDQLSILCSLAMKRLESQESVHSLAVKETQATRLRHFTSSSELSSTGNLTLKSPLTSSITSPLNSPSAFAGVKYHFGGGGGGGGGEGTASSPPPSHGGGLGAKKAAIQTFLTEKFRRRSVLSRPKSASETNLRAFIDGLSNASDVRNPEDPPKPAVKARRGNSDIQSYSQQKLIRDSLEEEDEEGASEVGKAKRRSSVEIAGHRSISRESSMGSMLSDIVPEDHQLGGGERGGGGGGWSLPASRMTSLDVSSEEDRVQSLPVIEMPDGMFDTVKRRKHINGKNNNSTSSSNNVAKKDIHRKQRNSLSADGLLLPNKPTKATLKPSTTEKRSDDPIVATTIISTSTQQDYEEMDRKLRLEDCVDAVVKRKPTEGGRKANWRRSMPAIFSGIKSKLTGSTNDLRKIALTSSTESQDGPPTSLQPHHLHQMDNFYIRDSSETTRDHRSGSESGSTGARGGRGGRGGVVRGATVGGVGCGVGVQASAGKHVVGTPQMRESTLSEFAASKDVDKGGEGVVAIITRF